MLWLVIERHESSCFNSTLDYIVGEMLKKNYIEYFQEQPVKISTVLQSTLNLVQRTDRLTVVRFHKTETRQEDYESAVQQGLFYITWRVMCKDV